MGYVIATVILITLGMISIAYAGPSFQQYVVDAPTEELMEKGRDYYRRNECDSALMIFSVISEKYSPELNPTDREKTILAQNNLGIIYAFDYKEFSQGYMNLSNAYDKAESNGLKNPQAIICLNLANILMQYESCYPSEILQDKIDEYSKKGIELAKEIGNYDCMAAIICNRLENNFNIDLALYQCIKDEKIPETTGTITYARRLLRAAELFQQKRYEEGRNILAIPIKSFSPSINPIWYETAKYNLIGKTYIEQEKFYEAEQSLKKALAISDSIKEPSLKLQTLSILSKIPDKDKIDYSRRYTLIRDSIMSGGNLRMAIELDFLHSIRREKEKSEALQESRKMLMQWLTAGGILIVIFAILLTIIIRQSVKLRERNRALYNQIQLQLQQPISSGKMEESISSSANISEEKKDEACQNDEVETQNLDKYTGSSLNSARSEEILMEITRVLNDTELICTPGFSLSQLASRVGVNTSYVSQVINEHYGESFSTLINDMRIRMACRRMNDTAKYGMITIEGIAESVGFQSRSTFIRAFKKVNGMTPSEYLKLVKSEGK